MYLCVLYIIILCICMYYISLYYVFVCTTVLDMIDKIGSFLKSLLPWK